MENIERDDEPFTGTQMKMKGVRPAAARSEPPQQAQAPEFWTVMGAVLRNKELQEGLDLNTNTIRRNMGWEIDRETAARKEQNNNVVTKLSEVMMRLGKLAMDGVGNKESIAEERQREESARRTALADTGLRGIRGGWKETRRAGTTSRWTARASTRQHSENIRV